MSRNTGFNTREGSEILARRIALLAASDEDLREALSLNYPYALTTERAKEATAEIARNAAQAAFEVIAEQLGATGDFAPDESDEIDGVFQLFVRAMALNVSRGIPSWEDPERRTDWEMSHSAEAMSAVDFSDLLALSPLVEEAWYAETKGEIYLADDEPDEADEELRNTVRNMALLIHEIATTTAAGQLDESGNEVGSVTPSEAARRIALALRVLMYGGS